MAVTLQVLLPQCRLLLRKSSVSFAERKSTLGKMTAIGRQPSVFRTPRPAYGRYPNLHTMRLPVSTNLVDETRRADAQPLAVLNPRHLPVASDGEFVDQESQLHHSSDRQSTQTTDTESLPAASAVGDQLFRPERGGGHLPLCSGQAPQAICGATAVLPMNRVPQQTAEETHDALRILNGPQFFLVRTLMNIQQAVG